ncbi:MAG TPA: hypothetical protein VNZ54_06275 [bacterium]|nr:hypothetical protein [bacterium]HXC64020.1 hypothetical protein [bacterium]
MAAALLAGWSARLEACACGCQIFDLGISDMPTTFRSDRLTLQYSFMDQDENQSGSALAGPAYNPDKRIQTSFYTVNVGHQFNHLWGVEVAVPYWQRGFVTDTAGAPGVTDGQAGANPDVQSAQVDALSDVRVTGMYLGLSDDMSIGLTFGLKLPTGPYTANALLDRDTEPGTGTTDLLLGAFDRGRLGPDWGWYAQTLLDAPLYARDGYEPGNNLDLAAGFHFDGLSRGTGLTPLLQANVTIRGQDSGGGDSATGNANSGYENFYLTPGLQEAVGGSVQLTEMVYLPVSRNVNGDQLVAPWMANATVSYLF